ncbi:unnamed protein product, partial [Porites lobata]
FSRSYCEELGQDVYLGKIGNDHMMLKIALVKCYPGSTVPQGSCVAVTNAVKVLKPKAVFSVGCCGGLDPAKVKLGDVVVSVKLITYSSSKVTDKGITESGVRVPLKANISKLMLNAADGWKAPLKSPKEFEVEMHRGVFLSGPESVDSSARREALNERFSEADVIEMEGEAYNEHFIRSNIVAKNVFSLFSVSHDSVLSLEILKDVWDESKLTLKDLLWTTMDLICLDNVLPSSTLTVIANSKLDYSHRPVCKICELIRGHYGLINQGSKLGRLFHERLLEYIKDGVIQDEDVGGTLAGKDVARRPAVMQPRKRDLKRQRRIRRKLE